MKREIRDMMMRTVSTVAMALTMTSFFTSCSKKNNDESVEESIEDTTIQGVTEVVPKLEKVNKDNEEEIKKAVSTSTKKVNRTMYIYHRADELTQQIIADAEEMDYKMFNAFPVYKSADGKYFIINKNEALSLVQKGEKFHIDFADKDKVVITNGDGEKYLVFNGQDSMEKFIDMLLGKVDTEDTEKVYTVIDDVYIGDTIECREVTVDDMEVRYYDLDTLISMLDKAREENDWVTPLSYSVEGDEVVFIRNGYDNNEETGEQTETELELKVLYGKEGDSYYESDLGKLYGCVFEDDKKMWVEESVLNDVLGFSAYIGNYTIPQTDTVINALVIDTAMGTASPEFVVDDVEEVESTTEEQPVEESTGESNIIIEDQFGGSSTEEQVDPNAPQYDENGELTNYDESIYEKTGVKVHLSGTPEEQAQQCYNAMCDAYPNIPWTVSSDVVGVEWPEMNLNITREEIDQINSELENAVGGRNVADMDLNELWDLLSNYYDADGSLKKEIGLAFTDKIDYMCQGFGGEMHYVSL